MLAVLLAAVLHATWNALAKVLPNKILTLWLFSSTGSVWGLGVMLIGGLPPEISWGYIAVSACIHLVYNIGLLSAYRIGDLSHVYPLARGMVPMVVAIVGSVSLGQPLSSAQWVALALIAGGLTSLTWARNAPERSGQVLAVATLTGLAISGYTIVDGIGVRLSQHPLSYAAGLFLAQGVLIIGVLTLMRRQPTMQGVAAGTVMTGIGAGLLSIAAYVIVLWAQTKISLAIVSALRETGVIFAAVIGWRFLHEQFGLKRVAAALVVALGVGLLLLI